MEPLETNTRVEDSGTEAAATPARPKRRHDGARETLRSLLVVVVGVLCIRTFVAEATLIPTGSMEQTILVGDHVFLNKLLYGPRLPFTSWRVPPLRSVHRQDIIAFHYPRNPSVLFVKRAIGLGGDVVRIENKKVYVNGQPVEEPYAHFQSPVVSPLRDSFPPTLSQLETLPAYLGLDPAWAREMPSFIRADGLHVPQGTIFAMGDNRDNSSDSRYWGFVPQGNIVGEPLFVYWSYDAPSQDWMNDDLMSKLKFDLSIVWNLVHKTRWSRTGKVF